MQSNRIIRGVDELKLQLSKLPAGSRITVAGKTAHGKGVERLKYPPAAVLDEIARYAKTLGIEVENPWQEYYEVPEWWLLYSWQSSDGVWNFSLLSASMSREPSIEEIKDKRRALRGLKELESRLSRCQPKSKIILAGSAKQAQAQKAERLQLPPESMLNELQRFAKAHSLQIEGSRRD